MKIDFASLAFGYNVSTGGNTPSWETPLGQGQGYKIKQNAYINEIIQGMIYCSIPITKVSIKIRSGISTGLQEGNNLVSSALFTNVYINDTHISDGKYILIINRDQSKSHSGRLMLKYGPSNTYIDNDVSYSNNDFYNQARKQLGLADDACFFVSEINVVEQDKLVLKTHIVNENGPEEYKDRPALRDAWGALADFNIELSVEENEQRAQSQDECIIANNIPENLSVEQLGNILSEMYETATNKTTAIHMFGIKYGPVIRKNKFSAASIVSASNISESYHVEVSKGTAIYDSILANQYGIKFYDGELVSESKTSPKSRILPKLSPRIRKRYSLNSILYGAPGTGKTYATAQYALAIIEDQKFEDVGKHSRETVMSKYNDLIEKGQIVFTTFHQNYGYEDFIQGIRPDTSSDEMKFVTADGVLKIIADKAMNEPEKDFIIIIDEINRANISKVFGELITLIEDDKRWGELNAVSVTLPSGESFAIPNNLYILGTMNSADKSISLIDTALRRRFDFVEFTPNIELVTDKVLKSVLLKLNEGLKKELNSTDLLIGHAYFMNKTEKDICNIMNKSIIPLLYEYFFDHASKVEAQLKKALDGLNIKIESENMGRIRISDKGEE